MTTENTIPNPDTALAAAVKVLGDIAHALGLRERLETMPIGRIREELMQQTRTDAELGELAAAAFEEGMLELRRRGHPDAQVFECGGDTVTVTA